MMHVSSTASGRTINIVTLFKFIWGLFVCGTYFHWQIRQFYFFELWICWGLFSSAFLSFSFLVPLNPVSPYLGSFSINYQSLLVVCSEKSKAIVLSKQSGIGLLIIFIPTAAKMQRIQWFNVWPPSSWLKTEKITFTGRPVRAVLQDAQKSSPLLLTKKKKEKNEWKKENASIWASISDHIVGILLFADIFECFIKKKVNLPCY